MLPLKTKQFEGPDFICIGMQKSGTGWFYDALKSIDKFCMLPIKELHHFDYNYAQDVEKKFHIKRLQRVFRNNKNMLPSDLVEIFSTLLNTYITSGLSNKDYNRLFSIKGNRLSGDITPSYSTLSKENVNEIYADYSQIKILVCVRHPVERAWSHYNMYLRNKMKTKGIKIKNSGAQKYIDKLASENSLREFIVGKNFILRSCPSRVLDNWSIFSQNLKIIDFSELVKDSNKVLQETLDFLLTEEGSVKLEDDFSVKDKKSNNVRVEFKTNYREILEEYFSKEISKCREFIPAIAKGW